MDDESMDQPVTGGPARQAATRGADELLREQGNLLAHIARGGGFDECLTQLCAAVARLSPGTHAAVLLADDEPKNSPRVIAPGLPAAFSTGVQRLPVDDPRISTSAAAMACGEPVTCADIAHDEGSSLQWRDLCAAHGILACHATPLLLLPDRSAAGSLTLFFDAPRAPDEWEKNLALFGAHIAGIALARERAERQLEWEQADAKMLQRISTEIIEQDDAHALYEKIMDAAVAIMHADFASLQMLHPERGAGGELRLLASRGYDAAAARFWKWVRTDSSCTCGVAMKTGKRAVAPDVRTCDFLAGTPDQANALNMGMLAMQSTPLISRSGRLVGMISTHWRTPHTPGERETRLFDILARQAADLIERRSADERLRASEIRALQALGDLQLHYDQSPVGLGQIDTELRFIRINDELAAMNGIPAADHIGRTIFEIVPDLAPKAADALRRIMDTGEPMLNIEIEGETAADPGAAHTFLESWFPLRGGTGRVIGLNIVAQDITERKLAEKALNTVHQRAQVLSETLEALLRADDPDHITRDLFDCVATHLGVDTFLNFMVNDQGDALRLHASAGIPDETARAIRHLEFGQAICGTVAQTCTPIHATDIQHSDDDKAALVRGLGMQAYACNPLMIGERLLGTLSFASRTRTRFEPDELEFLRSITQYVAVAMDRLQQQHRLRLAKEEAEAASRAKDNFMAQLSHELRTPLTPVLMSASALRDDESLPDATREQLAMMVRNITLEARLIDDLLDLTRITRGKLSLRTETCDLHALLANVLAMVREEAREKRIELTVDLAAQRCRIDGDAARLQQVFWNLLRNAVKFTPHGGHVRLASHDAHDSGESGRLCVAVSDNGIGFDPAATKRLFVPFAQEDGHGHGGLGLGLAIAHAIVEQHGGALRAESQGPGCGAVFTVELPGTSAINGTTHHGREHSPAIEAEPSMRLLLVEDHEATLQVLSRLLGKAGHRVTSASTLAAARSAAETETFDAVISDLGLPDGTGFELMAHLRDTYGLRGVAISGYGMDEDVRRSSKAGFAAHLVKPVDASELRRTLRMLAAK